MWNLGSGFAQGVYENHRGLDEKREYEELSQQRELARQRTQQIIDKDKIQMETMKYQLDALRMENLKMAAGNEKLKMSERFTDIVNAVTNNRGKFRTDTQEEIDGNNLPENFDKTKYTYDPATNKYRGVKTEYTMPKDVEQAVNQFKRDVVIDPDGSRWINGIMGNAPDNPVIDVTYNPAKEEMVFMTKDGKERHMQLDMVAYGLGFDKQMKLADINRMNEDMARSKALYELENKKAEAYKNTAAGNKYNEEARYAGMDAQSRALNAHANEVASQAAMIRASSMGLGSNMTAAQIKEQNRLRLEEQRKDIEGKSDKEFYEAYQNNPELMEKDLQKNGAMRQNLANATTSALIVKEMEKFEAKANVLMKLAKSATVDDKIKGEVAKYFPDITPADWNDRAKLMSELETQAKQIAANQIKLLSGAAFTTEEFKNQVNAYLEGINNLKSVDTWASSLKALKNQWSANVAGYNGLLNKPQKRFLKGLIESSNDEATDIMHNISQSANVSYLNEAIQEMKGKSPEEQQAWYSGLSPEMKATLKAMREKDME